MVSGNILAYAWRKYGLGLDYPKNTCNETTQKNGRVA